jgi:glycosyltransferase involved in cell wall biosynthesis
LTAPKFSVVIPAYNQANYLIEAIQSVLDQTYGNFELIVVNDASPDETHQVVGQFVDDRIKYLLHEQNRGLPATRNTGIRASTGELIALLDADDYYHPNKLESHLNFYQEHSDIGATYNNRFELNYSAKTIRNLYRAPSMVGLQDFVLGFPFAPSDMVIRREWAFKVNLFNENYRNGAEDIDFPAQLALCGCKFGRVDKALNFRRYKSGRKWKNLRLRMEDALLALENIFIDSRCPAQVLDLRDLAIKNHYEILTFPAFLQGETELGRELLWEAIRLVPSIVQGNPCHYVKMLTRMSTADENQDHVSVIDYVFSQLPKELMHLSEQKEWAVGRGYMIKGLRSLIWGSEQDANSYFAQAAEEKADLDEAYLRNMANQLIDHASQFDDLETAKLLEDLSLYVSQIGGQSSTDFLKGCYFLNQAYRYYHQKNYLNARSALKFAVRNRPAYLVNRGVISLLIHSFVQRDDLNKVAIQNQPYR